MLQFSDDSARSGKRNGLSCSPAIIAVSVSPENNMSNDACLHGLWNYLFHCNLQYLTNSRLNYQYFLLLCPL